MIINLQAWIVFAMEMEFHTFSLALLSTSACSGTEKVVNYIIGWYLKLIKTTFQRNEKAQFFFWQFMAKKIFHAAKRKVFYTAKQT